MEKFLVFAHRGFSSVAPENTLASFRKALENECDGVEFDVQLTKDKIPVVIHDESLLRTCGIDKMVKDIDFKELKKYSAGKFFSEEFYNEKVPTLEEVLNLFSASNKLINVELKTNVFEYPGIEDAVHKLLNRFNLKERAIISSFNHHSLKRFRLLDADCKIALLFNEKTKDLDFDYINEFSPYSVNISLANANSKCVKLITKKGFKALIYTVNDMQKTNELKQMGASGVFTDVVNITKYVNVNVLNGLKQNVVKT